MSENKQYYEAIDDIIHHIKKDFIGPISEDEIIENEDPLSKYSLGILWAQQKKASSTQINDLSNEEELFEDNLDDSEELSNNNIYKPSTIALSFNVFSDDSLNIKFEYANYLKSEDSEDENNSNSKYTYIRKKHQCRVSTTLPSGITNKILKDDETDPVKICIYVRRKNENGSSLVTVSVLNKNTADNNEENNMLSLFQCKISIESHMGFLPLYSGNTNRTFEEEKNDMLYDEVNNYSYGHGCASVFEKENGIIKRVCSSFIPSYRMLQMMPRSLENSEYLLMKYWKNTERKTACNSLYRMISEYENWFKKLKENNKLISKYEEPASQSFHNISECIERLKNGIKVLKENDLAWKSFVYMNEAMLLQRIKTKNCDENIVKWYPFQMAFIVQIIPDIVENKNDFHNIVDLLWFPTGGGKTEAYLGLAAFTIFYRRLSLKNGEDVNGVTIIMRYTLRLLTLQQFERAMALICACESLRKKYKIPGDEISIGLWIGSGMTPNHIEGAKKTLQKKREDINAKIYEADPMQVTKCPWCGSEIGLNEYEIIENSLNIRCSNPRCEFKNHFPIYVVDDDIYRMKPTLLLSTIDKFARLTWEEKAGNLLGADGNKPPELIIQDELHLISGPLGSISGIYEMAMDEIIKYYGGSPKIIASTATVKNADEQIKVLYNRDMIQFPPNGLSYKDSFFAVEANEENRPARTYLGLCSVGSTSSEIMIKLFALFVYLKHLYKKQNKPLKVIDQFFTTVGYFNSLRELGTTSVIIKDRIINEIRYLINHKFKNEASMYDMKIEKGDISEYLNSNELTSRNSTIEIKNVLEKLQKNCSSDDCYDYIMASNMLSVGIDIDRLGVMCMYGQPKLNAEYIQATSRVGRNNPGLVVTLYNGLRSRDKSYYEQFIYYHRTFYKYVESTSVTPYSARAIEKALHCAFVAIIRHTIKRYNSNESARNFKAYDNDIEYIKYSMIERIDSIKPRMVEYAQEWLDWYLECWEKCVESNPNGLVYFDYKNSDRSLFKQSENGTYSDIPIILNSARNVEPTSDIYFVKR